MLDVNVNVAQISKLISRMTEYATCLECCKYYIAPMSAICGHSLCHDCWIGRRSCPTCSTPVNRKELRVNTVLNTLTQHLHAYCDKFEKNFNVNLNDFMLDISVVKKDLKSRPKTGPVNHIDNWLTNSQNHFSVPPTNSQHSTQDVVSAIKLTTNKIQIHSDSKKDIKVAKVVHVSPPQQDWDKIETITEIQSGIKDKENIVGPTDIEPFYINENETTDEILRRSSRKRELKNNNCNVISKIDMSLNKEHIRNLNIENEKRIQKTKSNWSSVKNMKKEFSKLNKTKKSKLDVSMEVIDKTENSTNKSNSEATLEVENSLQNNQNQDKVATPNSKKQFKIHNDKLSSKCTVSCLESVNSVSKKEQKSLITETGKIIKVDNDQKKNDSSVSYEHLQDDNNIVKNISETENTQTINEVCEIETSGKERQKNNTCSVHVATDQISDNLSINRITENNSKIIDNQIIAPDYDNLSLDRLEQNKAKIPFIKKSFILEECKQTSNNNKFNDHHPEPDDIEISIRIGNSLAKINIRKKENNINFNINKDCAIQVALGPYGLSKSHCSIDQEIQVFSNENENKNADTKMNENEVVHSGSPIKNLKTVLEKSVSTKKHTASADTSTAQFEITESVEKELSDVMKFVEIKEIGNKSAKCTQQSEESEKRIKNRKCTLNLGTVNAEYFNDVDLFDSETIKEPNVRLLTNTHRCPSEILAPTVKSVNFKTQRHSDKREREVLEDDIPLSKRMKINLLNTKHNNSEEVGEKTLQDSELMSYDQVISQVFASIDADIGNSKKSQQYDLSAKEISGSKQPKCITQVIRKASENEVIPTQTEEETNSLKEKRSANVFSLIEKETLPKGKNEVPGIDTQKNIDNLLTPGMYCELTSTQEKHNAITEADMLEDIIATPLDDDSDKSVVEDTPQKKSSFSRVSHKSDSKNVSAVSNRKQNPGLKIDQLKQNTSVSLQINQTLNSTAKSAKLIKKLTPINAKLLETPKSLINFSDNIQYKSTPVAKKSLNFCNNEQSETHEDDPDQTLCPTTATLVGNTTQEREFMSKAFEKTPRSPVGRPLMLKNSKNVERRLCIGGSCLRLAETKKVQLLCQQRQWSYVEKYTEDLTHLVIGVDEENKAQRSVKYICALAAGKWIVNSEWVDQCLYKKEIVDEAPYEVLDSTGDAGPTYSRLAQRKLFEGITFCCLPPFSTLDVDTLKMILKAAGGHVVDALEEARVTADVPSLVIAEPDCTDDSRSTYLAIKLGVVPVNFEWALNCLGAYSLQSVLDLLLCPSALLPPATASWPAQLMARDDSVTFE